MRQVRFPWRLMVAGALLPGIAAAQATGIMHPGGSLTLNVNGQEVLRATNAKNVGIGTTNPAYPLDVSASLRVKGSSSTSLLQTDQEIYSQNGPLYLNYNSTSNTVINGTGGNVGIGTNGPSVKLDVSGTIVSRGYNAGSSTTIDWSLGNVQYTSASCSGISSTTNFTNMQDGGSYSLIVTGSSGGTPAFGQSGLTTKTTAAISCTSSKHTVFTFLRAGSNIYVNYITGY